MNFLFLSLLALGQNQPMLTDLTADSAELKEAYNKADGRVRLVLFLSPT